jgi:DNA-binding MarR family transcriptional regulator
MSEVEQFSEVLHAWVKVFMERSMTDFKRFMDASDLSPSQVNILMRLHFRGMCDVSEIGEQMGVTNAAASQAVDRLVQKGLLERTEDPIDRRVKQLRLSPHGEKLVEESFEARRRWMDGLTAVLSPEQQEQVAVALTVLTDAARLLAAPAAVNDR